MKKFKLLPLISFACLSLTGCQFVVNYNIPFYPGSLNGNLGYEDTGVDDSGFTGEITVWCAESIVSLTKSQINKFISMNKQYNINLRVDFAGEDKAASSMIENVRAGADIYIFAQDQLTRLKTAGALSGVPAAMATAIEAESTEEAVEAAKLNGKMYAFPFTSDNGYFMYYDKSVFTEEQVGSIESILEICKQKGYQISYPVFTNGWYSTSYFMATGCESDWSINSKNLFVDYEDSYKTNGLDACRGLHALNAYSEQFNTKDVADMNNVTKVVISGVWDYALAYEKLGENLGCTKMPTFTVGENTYNISSYMGHKLVGVRPSSDAKRQSVCQKIARYLSNEDSQNERFDSVKWGPTNKAVAAREDVQNHPGLKALEMQKPYAKNQSPTPDNWFSNVQSLALAAKTASDDAAWNAALDGYTKNLPTFLD